MSQAWWVTGTRRTLLLLACVGAVMVASCVAYSASPLAGVEGSRGRNASVTIQTFQFRPTPIEVRAATRVTWTNQDDILHKR
jgi:plastocyanin